MPTANDGETGGSLLERFGPRKSSDASVETTVRDIRRKKVYLAAEMDQNDERVRRLKIYFSNGDVYLPNYAYLSNAYVEGDTYMGMVFDIGGIEIRGKNLGKLLDGLQDERIRVLRYFDPEQYEMPLPGEPIIESIARLITRSSTS